MQSTTQMVFWLVVVLLLIPASLWLFKNSGLVARFTHSSSTDQVMQLISQTSLGPGQKVVTLEVNTGSERIWLILGVTGHSITTLSQMPAANLTQQKAR